MDITKIWNLTLSICGKFLKYLSQNFLPLASFFCAGLFGRKLGFLAAPYATVNYVLFSTFSFCFLFVLCFSFLFFIWRLCKVKKAHCELIDLFAPGGTKKSLRTVFSFFLLLEYFLDTGVHIFSTLVLRRFIGKFLQIFLKSASITSFFFLVSVVYNIYLFWLFSFFEPTFFLCVFISWKKLRFIYKCLWSHIWSYST